MSEIVLLDMSILIDDLRTGKHSQRIATIEGILRTSSVVLAELWRGASSSVDRKILSALAESPHSHPHREKLAGIGVRFFRRFGGEMD